MILLAVMALTILLGRYALTEGRKIEQRKKEKNDPYNGKTKTGALSPTGARQEND
jgi:hypothetical protein